MMKRENVNCFSIFIFCLSTQNGVRHTIRKQALEKKIDSEHNKWGETLAALMLFSHQKNILIRTLEITK